MGWEYLRICWTSKGVYLSPAEKFERKWIEELLEQNFPDLRKPRIQEFGSYGRPEGRPLAWHIDRLDNRDHDVAIEVIQAVGSKGWEAIQISGGPPRESGSAWFKRELSE